MSYQVAFCPGCGTRRVAHGYRCSVCDGLVRRLPVRVEHASDGAESVLSWPRYRLPQAVPLERRPAAA